MAGPHGFSESGPDPELAQPEWAAASVGGPLSAFILPGER
jgi:hypothetical protein